MNKKKILTGVLLFVLLICILIFVDRKFKITSLGYESLDVKNEYVSIVFKSGPKEKQVIKDKEDIEKCINYINDLQVREYDLLDQILDPETYQRDHYLGPIYLIELNKENGESNVLQFNITGEGEIWYNGKRYIIKNKMSDYLIGLVQ